MKDVLGRELKFGDKIIHYSRWGGSLRATEFVVINVEENRVKVAKEKKYSWERQFSWLFTPEYIARIREND